MSFLKRVSDGLWSYVSLKKTTEPLPAPQTASRLQKPHISARKGTLQEVVRHDRSMSPTERVDNWRLESSSIATESAFGGKRKRLLSSSTASAERRKLRKAPYVPWDHGEMFDDRSDVDMEDVSESQDGGLLEGEDAVMDGEDHEGDEEESKVEVDDDEGFEVQNEEEPEVKYEDEGDISSHLSNIDVAKFPPPEEFMDDEEDLNVDETLVISKQEFEDSFPQRKVFDITAEQQDRHVSVEELRAQGWNDEHITLVQKIAMRGYEPILPGKLHFGMCWLPKALFAENDDAFISSVRGKDFLGERILETLFELGGRMRSALHSPNGNTPERQVRRHVLAFTRLVNLDADFDKKTVIPLIALVIAPASTEATVLQAIAKRKLEKLANKYRAAFRAQHSIENSPLSSKASTQYTYPIPTLYAIIASHTLVALVACRPEDAAPDIKTVALFDFKDKDYDVWNALALAITMCHARNVQLRIGVETGLGIKGPGWVDDSSDPDA